MTKGVLLIALGHHNYLQMAIALAASIKTNDPDLSVTLATNIHVASKYARLFDQVRTVPDKMYMNGKKVEYIKSKLHMYDLSPYDETIFLDVDQLLIVGKKLSPVFTELASIDFTMSNTGKSEVSVWADVEEVKKKYSGLEFWNFHSEFVYFKKGDKAQTFFDAAKKAYKDNKIKSATRFSGATMADELAFQIAAMVTGIYPHKEGWTPNFWWGRENKARSKYPYQLKEHFTTYSIGGNRLPAFVRQNYNNLAAYYFSKMKLQQPYKASNKRSFLTERIKF